MLDALPEKLAELYRELEDTLLYEICSRLKISGKLNEVTVQSIRELRSHGIDIKEIKKAISETAEISEKELDKLIDDVLKRNEQYFDEVITLADVTKPPAYIDKSDIDAVIKQTHDEISNITRSMGFYVRQGGRKVLLDGGEAYQWALDNAVMQIQSGTISYEQAISSAVKQLADSGLKTVKYESGHVDSVDIAVRRAVLTGVNQLNAKYNEQAMQYLDTDLVEVSAHIGARNIGVGPANHESWQGKVYRWKEKSEKNTDSTEPSPNITTIQSAETNGGEAIVTTVGKIDIEKYKVISDEIQTDEVIITDERIKHIKERHPNDYERYAKYITDIVKNPQYILEANKPNLAFLLKEYVENGERFQLILRLAVAEDNPEYKNSVITFLKISERKWNRYLRNKKILYKLE